MDIILSNSSDKPIYEQIASQIRAHILAGTLVSGEKLPSIRALANGLGVSVITTKRAYSDLEEAGFIETVQGKGLLRRSRQSGASARRRAATHGSAARTSGGARRNARRYPRRFA